MPINYSKLTKPTFSDWFLNDVHEHDADHLGEELEWNLTKDADFSIAEIPWDDFEIPDDLIDRLKKGPRRLKEKDLTQRIPRGIGIFDAIMEAMSTHLKEEFATNRITGAEYSKTYAQMFQASLSGAIQFLTSQESLEWQSMQAQIAAIKAMCELAILRAQLAAAHINAHQARANYALTKMKLATEDATYANIREKTRTQEQETEAVRGQTADTTTKGARIVGLIGRQKQLQLQQIYSFQHSDQQNAAKLAADYQGIVKTADEGAQPPSCFTNSGMDSIFNKLEDNVFNEKAEQD